MRGLSVWSLNQDGQFDGLSLETIGGGFASLVLKTRHRRFGDLCLKTIDGGFDRFGPQNQGHKLKDIWRHHEALCRQLKMK